MSNDRFVRSAAHWLPFASTVVAIVMVSFAYNVLDARAAIDAREDVLAAAAGATSEDSTLTSHPAAYLHWAGMWWALVASWIVMATVAAAIVRRRGESRFDLSPWPRVVVTTALVTAGLCLLAEWAGMGPQVPHDDRPAAAQARNLLGWACGALIVAAHGVILHDVWRSRDLPTHSQELQASLADLRMLLIGTGATLAVGVAQIAALARLQMVSGAATALETPTGERGSDIVALHPAVVELEAPLTVSTGLLFAGVAALSFLPGVVLLERLRRDELSNSRRKAPPAGGEAALTRSAWTIAAAAASVLLPIASGLLVTELG